MEISPTDYKAGQIQGKQRCYGGKFSNVQDGTPSETFSEEVVSLDLTNGRIIHTEVESCTAVLTDPTKVLILRNPLNNSIITPEQFAAKIQAQGGFRYEDYQIFKYSLYRQTADERDAARAAAQGA